MIEVKPMSPSACFLRPLAFIVMLALGACTVPSNEPANLSQLKTKVGEYIDNGDYDKDVSQVAETAKQWVEQRAARGGKLAVVFDIDETTLSNLPHLRREDWGYNPQRWEAWVDQGSAHAIAPVRGVYRAAIAKHVAVFFISGRRESGREATRLNLAHEGMQNYTALIVRSNTGKESVADYKSSQRARISGQGYTIIANVGDQFSDFAGTHSERDFKLPNPFYFIK